MPGKKAYLFAGLAVFFWSTVATAFKLALREYDFIQLIFVMSLVSVVILFTFLLIQKKAFLIHQQTKKEWFNSALLGVFNPLAYYLILFKAYSLLPAQLAQPLNMVWPIVLVLMSVPLLKQKIRRSSFVALAISFVGVVIISSQGGMEGFRDTSRLGVFLALASSVMWASYWIFSVRDKRDSVVKLFTNFLFGFIFLVPVVFFFSDFRFTPGLGLYALIYIGFFEAGVTYVFWMKAMQMSTNNAKIGNLVFVAPFVSLIFIHFILKETIYITTFIGLIFIVAGILVQKMDKGKG